jgi:hypothetical protein
VKEMARFLNVWHYNESAPWPTDPVEMAKVGEMMIAAIDKALKTGDLLEFGFFPDGAGGYAISEREAKDQLGGVAAFWPWCVATAWEMIPFEIGKEIYKGVWKAQTEAMAAMKR